jgi:hypothetical protein
MRKKITPALPFPKPGSKQFIELNPEQQEQAAEFWVNEEKYEKEELEYEKQRKAE